MTEVNATSIMYDTENNSMLHILHLQRNTRVFVQGAISCFRL